MIKRRFKYMFFFSQTAPNDYIKEFENNCIKNESNAPNIDQLSPQLYTDMVLLINAYHLNRLKFMIKKTETPIFDESELRIPLDNAASFFLSLPK